MEELITHTQRLSEEAFEHHVITGTWAAKEILSHVAAWDMVFVDLSKSLLRNEPFLDFPAVDTFNRKEVSKRRGLAREDIVGEVRQNRKTYIEVLREIPEEQLLESRGRFTIGGLAQDIVSHDRYHLQQIVSEL